MTLTPTCSAITASPSRILHNHTTPVLATTTATTTPIPTLTLAKISTAPITVTRRSILLVSSTRRDITGFIIAVEGSRARGVKTIVGSRHDISRIACVLGIGWILLGVIPLIVVLTLISLAVIPVSVVGIVLVRVPIAVGIFSIRIFNGIEFIVIVLDRGVGGIEIGRPGHTIYGAGGGTSSYGGLFVTWSVCGGEMFSYEYAVLLKLGFTHFWAACPAEAPLV